jgi:hypothetical protein
VTFERLAFISGEQPPMPVALYRLIGSDRYVSSVMLIIATPINPKAKPGKASAKEAVDKINPLRAARQMTVPARMSENPNPIADELPFFMVILANC